MQPEFDKLFDAMSRSGCAKKQVVAGTYVYRLQNGISQREFLIAGNYCTFDGSTCPRLTLPTGVGYELCQSVHAETALIRRIDLEGWSLVDRVLWVAGHYYVCEPCATAAKAHGFLETRYREERHAIREFSW